MSTARSGIKAVLDEVLGAGVKVITRPLGDGKVVVMERRRNRVLVQVLPAPSIVTAPEGTRGDESVALE